MSTIIREAVATLRPCARRGQALLRLILSGIILSTGGAALADEGPLLDSPHPRDPSAPFAPRDPAYGIAPRAGVPDPLFRDPAGGDNLSWRGSTLADRGTYGIKGNYTTPGLLSRYHEILMDETARRLRRHPDVFWAEPFTSDIADIDEDVALARARYQAERIFGSTHGEILSRMLDSTIERSRALTALNNSIRGLDFGIRSGGADAGDPGYFNQVRRSDPLRLNFIVSNKPRVELRARFKGGTRARVEVPLASPGMRLTVSRPLFPGVSGALRAGVEDMGEETWVSAHLNVSF